MTKIFETIWIHVLNIFHTLIVLLLYREKIVKLSNNVDNKLKVLSDTVARYHGNYAVADYTSLVSIYPIYRKASVEYMNAVNELIKILSPSTQVMDDIASIANANKLTKQNMDNVLDFIAHNTDIASNKYYNRTIFIKFVKENGLLINIARLYVLIGICIVFTVSITLTINGTQIF